ncbi:hypothetical protein PG996_014233 [Apiospora saccharicola]|uniref:NACHT domain-containing protein n=1 Tax=Apiospora saccharicola TaxID=335842 RepID=A0ABR1THS2_9PEZI
MFRRVPPPKFNSSVVYLSSPSVSKLALSQSPSDPADPATAVHDSLQSKKARVITKTSAESPTDVWSAAYHEAVDSLGEGIDIAILEGENVTQLFKRLEAIDKDATEESAFMKGVKYLHTLQVPLERFKMALDLASPLTSIEPTAATVFGVRSNRPDIHKALVSIYRKLLEFYNAAFDILTRRGARLVMKMILETDLLPNIVKEFLQQAENLRRVVEKVTWEIVEDIKSMLYNQESSDKIKRQGQKHAYLQQLRADEACKLLLSNTKLTGWYNATASQELVIMGDMGCGKTAAMAFLVDELIRQNKCHLPQPKVCYHYCHDDETGQAAHIFSSLILSLLEQLSGLKKTLFEWYKEASASGNVEAATNPKKLEEFLDNTLESIDRPIFIVIDGLDECEKVSRRILFHALRCFVQKSPRLRILLSTRPEEEILQQLAGVPLLNFQPIIDRDQLIVDKLVEESLSYLPSDVGALVKETLARLAQGSAMWTRMMVDLIEVRGITTMGPMRTFLQNMPQPGKLAELYVKLLSRYTSDDSENLKIAISALEVLAMSQRDLSILELAWAVTMNMAPKDIRTVADIEALVDARRVLNRIRPFVADVDFSDLKKRQVRLAHQSVKELVLGGLDTHWPEIKGLALSETQGLSPDRGSEALEAVGKHGENMVRYDPSNRGFGELFVYASCHWIEHAGAVKAPHIPELRSIETLCQAGSLRLKNWTAQHSRPQCTIQPRLDWGNTPYDPLSVIALYGSQAMLHDMMERSDLKKGFYRPCTVMEAVDVVVLWGDLSRVRTLFQGVKTGPQLRNLEFFCLVIKRWSESDRDNPEWDKIFDLVDDVQDMLVEERWDYELLSSTALKKDCKPMLQRLAYRVQQTADLEAEPHRAA